MENLLIVWINGKQLAGNSVSDVIICEKVDFYILTLCEMNLVLVLKNLRLVNGKM